MVQMRHLALFYFCGVCFMDNIRKWHADVLIKEKTVQVVVDITGMEQEKLFVGISNLLNSLVLKYEDISRDFPISVKVLDDFEMSVHNSVLVVDIKRLLNDSIRR